MSEFGEGLDLTKETGCLCSSCLERTMNVYYANERPVGAWCPECNFLAVISEMRMIPLRLLIGLLESECLAECDSLERQKGIGGPSLTICHMNKRPTQNGTTGLPQTSRHLTSEPMEGHWQNALRAFSHSRH